MLHLFKRLLVVAAVVSVSTVPTLSQAQSSKSDSMSAKSGSASGTNKNQASTDEFEENRKAHMQKSKENNAKKGAE